ncbi:MAG: AI-2E family transporter [Nitrospirae bacterium]|nr:AI-2E family transporter [Nitrospirota bacterium]
MVQVNKFYIVSLVILILVFGFLSYQVMEPFLTAIAWALVLGIVFYPLFLLIGRVVKWRVGASLITLFIIVFMIAGPIFYMFMLMGKEVKLLIEYLNDTNYESITHVFTLRPVTWFLEHVHVKPPNSDLDIKALINENVVKIGQNIMPHLTYGVKNVFIGILNFTIMVFTLFFFFIDGPRFINKIMALLPFSKSHRARLSKEIKDMVISAIYGGVVVSFSQGIVAGLVFYFLDVKAPVLLGTFTVLMSFIPGGAVAVWGVVDIILFLNGSYTHGIILLLAGTFGISMIDNILRPIIVSGRTNVPVLIIFFAVIGGIKEFGMVGIIMGPLVLVLFVSLVEIFRTIEEENAT